MMPPIRQADLELSVPLEPLAVDARYESVQFLVRLHGRPVGVVQVPVAAGRVSVDAQCSGVLTSLGDALLRHLADLGLERPVGASGFTVDDLLTRVPAPATVSWPSVTVAVCTRDRPAQLAVCLEALIALDYPAFDIVIVDNAPRTDGVRDLIAARYPQVRHVVEPRPGLDWARNRAIVECRGEVLAFTDDDVVVDRGWLRGLARELAQSPEIMAVTGLVLPYELETDAQHHFEWYGGFGKGFRPRWFQHRVDHWGHRFLMHGAGLFGTGANMAFRRSLFDRIGFFDPVLDVGTPTNGGGDLDIYFRVLQAGFGLFYAPDAVVRHQHRRDAPGLRYQLEGWGTGFGAYRMRELEAFPAERDGFREVRRWWRRRVLIRLVRSVKRKEPWMRTLVLAEVRGTLKARACYAAAKRQTAETVKVHGPQPGAVMPVVPDLVPAPPSAVAVRTVDLAAPLAPLTDLDGFGRVALYVALHGRLLGKVEIANHGHSVSVLKLRETIASSFYNQLVDADGELAKPLKWARTFAALTRHFTRSGATMPAAGAADTRTPASVSVVVATYDRPDDLRGCLESLRGQVSSRDIEVVVVDNHPASGLTPPVVAGFPGVVLVEERRAGLSYARNAGIVASRGEIILMTDDDVVAPPDWIERIARAFDQPHVKIVTGNVLPIELGTEAQRRFEQYGGLGRGFAPKEFGPGWFGWFSRHAVPTWQLGATANAGFRADIFRHPEIGLLDERLGAGSPTGCSEDTYLFYRTLKAGFTVRYEPTAWVWHRHRRDEAALRRQVRSYSKGHVAYHLVTLIDDGDRRALWRICWDLPYWHARRLARWIRGRRDYPLWMILEEMRGNLAGPWALWRSHRRVAQLGRSPRP